MWVVMASVANAWQQLASVVYAWCQRVRYGRLGRRRHRLTAAAAAAATVTDAGETLSRSVDRELLLWTFYNAPVTPPSGASRRYVGVDVWIRYDDL